MKARRCGIVLTFVLFAMIFMSVNVAADDTVTVEVSGLYGQTEARSMLTRINNFRTGRYVDGGKSAPWAYASDGSVDYASYTNLGELQYDYDLEQTAMQRAMEIALQFSHTRPTYADGSNDQSCFEAFPSGYTATGENIATGYGGSPDTAIEAFDQWAELNDPYEGQGHRRNMLSRDFNRIGIAFVKIHFSGKLTEGTRPYTYSTDICYWVQSLGKKTGSAGLTPTAASDTTMTKNVTVLKSNIEKAAIALTKESLNIDYGDSYDFNDASSQIRLEGTWPDEFKVRWSDGATSVGTYCASVQGGYTLTTANSNIAGLSGKTITGKKAGNTTVTATSAFDSTATGTVNVIVVPKSISGATVTPSVSSYQYTGSAITPSVTVTLNGTTLTSGVDYDASITNNTNAGTAQITITGKGNYKDTATGQFTITPKPINDSSISVDSIAPVEYNGSNQAPEPVVKDGTKTLIKGTDYTLSYSNNKNAGQATVTISGKGNYSNSRSASFTIQKKPLTESMVVLDKNEFMYNTQTQKPTVDVSLAQASDYTVTNNGGKNRGEYEVVVSATAGGNLTGGPVTKKYSIVPRPISDAAITAESISSRVFNGQEQTPEPTLKYGQKNLIKDTDYTVRYDNNVNASNNAMITISGVDGSNYTGNRVVTFTITKKNLADSDVYVRAIIVSAPYSGSAIKPRILVDAGDWMLGSEDFSVEYFDNINAGTARAVVTAKDGGNYIGTNHTTFGITPKTITDDMISLTKTSYEYIGKQINPVPSYNEAGLSKNVDISYGPNIDVGQGTVKFTGKGNYQGEVTKTFNIVKANNKVTELTVTSGKVGDSKLYSWELKSLFGASNATVYFSNSANGSYSTTGPKTAGTYYAKAYIPGTSNYNEVWSEPVKFTIEPKTAPTPTTVKPKPTTAPTGKVTILNTIANSAKKTNDVIWDKSKVKNATNYEINWRARGASKWASTTVGNTVRGTTSGLTIKGLYEIRVRPKNSSKAGQWSNSVYRYFHTTEKIRLASKSKGSFTMSWKKNPQVTGYQVLFTTNKNGSGAANNINTVGASATSFTKSGLRSGTTYYVQVREIKKVGSITYIGNISCPVAIKVK